MSASRADIGASFQRVAEKADLFHGLVGRQLSVQQQIMMSHVHPCSARLFLADGQHGASPRFKFRHHGTMVHLSTGTLFICG